MRVLNIHSQQHKWMYEQVWLPTLMSVEPGVVVDVVEAPQLSATASYGDEGWRQQMAFKAGVIRERLKTGEPFVYSDTDVVFVKPFMDDLRKRLIGCDAAFQFTARVDCPYCAGFAVYNSTSTCIDLIDKTLEVMEDGDTIGDQHALNRAMRSISGFDVVALPNDYWHPGMMGDEPGRWTPDMPIDIPETVKIVHATWVISDHKQVFFKRVMEFLGSTPEEFADKLLLLMRDDDLSRRVSKGCRKYVIEQCDNQDNVCRFLSDLRMVVKETEARRRNRTSWVK